MGLKPECVEELASGNQFLIAEDGFSRAVLLTIATALSVEVEVLRNRPSNDVDQVAARTRSAPRHLLEGEPNPIRPKRPTETRDEPSHPSSKNATTSPPPPRTAKPPSRRAAPVDSAIRRMPSRTSVVVPETGFIPHTRSRTSSSPTTSSARESIRRRRVSDQDVAEGAASTFSAGTRRANRSAFSSSSKPPLANSTRTKNEARRDLAVPGSTGSTLREGDSSQSGVCRPLSAQSPRSPLRAQTDASPGNLAGSVIGAGSGCTVLRSGVPCVVRVGDGNIPCNLRAEVRFIGPLPGAAGDWIGVEAYESDIPRDAANLPWSDGSRNGGELTTGRLPASNNHTDCLRSRQSLVSSFDQWSPRTLVWHVLPVQDKVASTGERIPDVQSRPIALISGVHARVPFSSVPSRSVIRVLPAFPQISALTICAAAGQRYFRLRLNCSRCTRVDCAIICNVSVTSLNGL